MTSKIPTPLRSETTRARRRPSAPPPHTVLRYRLRLIKEDEETVAEPETLILPREITEFLWRRVFEGLDREAMCGVYVDVKRRVIGWTVAYVGCLTRCSVEPRGLITPALLANASGILIAHNHPSGGLDPSVDDRFFTRRMHAACDVMGLNLIDSLVIAEGPDGAPGWTSLASTPGGW